MTERPVWRGDSAACLAGPGDFPVDLEGEWEIAAPPVHRTTTTSSLPSTGSSWEPLTAMCTSAFSRIVLLLEATCTRLETGPGVRARTTSSRVSDAPYTISSQ